MSCPTPTPPPASGATWLRFTGLYRGFGRLRVLRDVSATVTAGELLLITGANGSGKSTLLRCLAGLLAPERGTIECRVAGRDLDTAERRRAVGYAAPDLDFYQELTTAENLDFFSRLRGGIDRERGRRLLAELGLPADRAAGALSSGMRQRLRWAWALLHHPAVLLLDEPLQNLDEPGRRDVLRLLAEHLRDGLAIVANPDQLDLATLEPRCVARHLELGG